MFWEFFWDVDSQLAAICAFLRDFTSLSLNRNIHFDFESKLQKRDVSGPVRGGSSGLIEPLNFWEKAKLNHLIFSIWLTIGNLGWEPIVSSLNHLIQNPNGVAVKYIFQYTKSSCSQDYSVQRKITEAQEQKSNS